MRAKSIPELSPEQIKRFWAKVEVHHPAACWHWLGGRNDGGYGQLMLNSGKYAAHRVAYTLLVGPVPPHLTIDHLCRNRLCVNPDHLRIASMYDNVMAAYGPPARNRRKTHCKYGHPFTPENTYVESSGGRDCLTCKRIRRRKAYLAHKEARV